MRGSRVCEMVFMRIGTFKRLFLVWKKCYGEVFMFVYILFKRDYQFNCLFSMKRAYRGVLWTGKNVRCLWVCFFNIMLNEKVASEKVSQNCLKHTTNHWSCLPWISRFSFTPFKIHLIFLLLSFPKLFYQLKISLYQKIIYLYQLDKRTKPLSMTPSPLLRALTF